MSSSVGIVEGQAFALRIINDAQYQENLLRAARNRLLPSGLEVTLLHYAFGRPTERMELGPPGSFKELQGLTEKELATRARHLADLIEGAEEGGHVPLLEEDVGAGHSYR
jgi:hypothetical protein